MTTYDIAYSFYGANREAIECPEPEVLLIGPAETGKTIALLWKLHRVAFKHAHASLIILRKTLTSAYSTVLVTFREKILGDNPLVSAYGGEKPQWFDYPNGSRIWVAGMDKSTRILSAGHDIIYVNQPEELTLDEWETLTTRTTGRAGHVPHPQTIGDPNPSYPSHWMYTRESIRRFYSWHKDNPTLYDPATGELLPQGERTLGVLSRLTGVRHKRLFKGQPAQPEGAIYDEYSEGIHRIYDDKLPHFRRFVAGQDWGYRNPGALGLWGLTGDDDMYLVAQYYRTEKRDDWWLEKALGLQHEVQEKYGHGIEAVVCDPSEPAYIDKFKAAGLNAIGGFNSVVPGINAVKKRLAERGLFFVRDSLRERDEELALEKKPTCVEDEIPSYVWADKTKEEPVKEDDHGCDMMRYAVAYVDGLGEQPKRPIRSMRR